jgi:hypothetical protein
MPGEPQNDVPAQPVNAPAVGPVYRDPKIDVQNIVHGPRNRQKPNRYDAAASVAASAIESAEPRNIMEAWDGKDGSLWKKATDDEYASLQEKGTFKLVPLPEGRKKIGCKWVFKIKRKADGSVDRHKARLVVQGFSQQFGVDYDEVYAPVARGNAIRTVLAIANHLDWDIHQMDVKTAFLNGDLDSEIYMKQPPGYVSKQHPDWVCKLENNLYGLKQGARCWNTKIDQYLKKIGYKQCSAEACVYTKTRKCEKTGKQEPVDFGSVRG